MALWTTKKAKLAHNKLTEQLAEKMKEEGITDLLIMSAGPYKHNSCMSAYCVDAQKMADAAGMLCWTSDGMIRYFSQVLSVGNKMKDFVKEYGRNRWNFTNASIR